MALDAVLADIAGQGVDATLCLGDHVSGPIDPAGSADRLMALDGPVIRGNHDRWLAEGNREGRELDIVDRYALSRMTQAHRAWLAAMPATAVFNGEVFLCHGTPASDDAPWLDDGTWRTSLRVVEYDHHAAGQRAADNGFLPWKQALATGWTDASGLF